jgi:hypothetical protein
VNATEINTELQKVMNRALSEGVIQKKVGFETVIALRKKRDREAKKKEA